LNSVPGVRCRKPDGAFYAFADVRGLIGLRAGDKTLTTDEDVAFWLLDTAHVAAVAGTPFGAPGYLRFSYASSVETIDEGIAAMRKAIEQAKASK
ncbi:MAG TPA: aminotransferase class I/II-fold pyridoxal phosphate-dependent enzyme, partial [Polyangiaceae bacterium]